MNPDPNDKYIPSNSSETEREGSTDFESDSCDLIDEDGVVQVMKGKIISEGEKMEMNKSLM